MERRISAGNESDIVAAWPSEATIPEAQEEEALSPLPSASLERPVAPSLSDAPLQPFPTPRDAHARLRRSNSDASDAMTPMNTSGERTPMSATSAADFPSPITGSYEGSPQRAISHPSLRHRPRPQALADEPVDTHGKRKPSFAKMASDPISLVSGSRNGLSLMWDRAVEKIECLRSFSLGRSASQMFFDDATPSAASGSTRPALMRRLSMTVTDNTWRAGKQNPNRGDAERICTEKQGICKVRLERLCNPSSPSSGDPAGLSLEEVEEDFENLFVYKNRHLKARLLHFAVYRAADLERAGWSDRASDLVRRVLDARADVGSKAVYLRGERVNELHAVHIAAGLGCVTALRVMADRVENIQTFVNTWCKLDGQDKFYLPIHDAAYMGRKDSIIWLLEHGADPSMPNIEGYTPLHWLAIQGLEPKADLEIVVKSMIKHKARLHSFSKESNRGEGKIPLQLAAADKSQFPRDLMHLLAPSLQSDEEGQSYSFFTDMCLLSSYNTRAANQLARLLIDSGDATMKQRMQRDAQKENAVDRMANLFHQAPEAAADMLDILMVKPSVQDSGHHPIRSRSSLWGLCYNKPMRCAYQADRAEKKKGGITLPEWKYDAQTREVRPWHLQLVQAPDEEEDGREYVDEVETKVVLLPNILDIDIFMALACTKPAHIGIFNRLPVQGVLYCLWDQLLLPAMYTRIFLDLLDLSVQASWGLRNIDGAAEEDTNSPLDAPMSWCIITAGLLRDVFNTVWWFWAHCQKWSGHVQVFREWQEGSRASAECKSPCSRASTVVGKQEQGRPPSLHALWRPRTFFTPTLLTTELPLMMVKAAFIWSTRCSHGGGAMNEFQQGMLTTGTLLQCMKLIYTLRLTNLGKRVTTILSAFFSGAICEMMVVVILAFGSVGLAFMILKRKQNSSWIMLYLYKGLLFGDGDALDYLGLNPESRELGVRTAFMIITTFVFSVCMLNLTIAIYGSEYDRLEKESEMHFLRERAKYCCEFLLGMQKLRIRAGSPGHSEMFLARGGSLLAFSLGCLLIPRSGPGLGALPLRLASSLLLAAAQVAVQSAWMASPWFPNRDDGREGPEEDHFLWICSRSEVQGDRAEDGGLGVSTLEGALDERLSRLEGKVQRQLGRLDEKVDGLAGSLQRITEQLGRLTPLQEAQHSSGD